MTLQSPPLTPSDHAAEAEAEVESSIDDAAKKHSQAYRILESDIAQTRRLVTQRLTDTSDGLLNDVRSAFTDAIRANQQAIESYKKEYVPESKAEEPALRTPGYYDGGIHALPGGHVLIREDDPASIIAFTLS